VGGRRDVRVKYRQPATSRVLASTWSLIPGGQTHEAMLTDEHLFEGIRGIPHHVEPIGYLQGLGCSPAHTVRIRSRPISTDDGDTRVIDQPLRQRVSAAVGQEIDEVVSLEVREDGPIGSATAKASVIHTQHARRRGSGKCCLPQDTQHAIATGSSAAQLVEQALAGLTTERKADPLELATQERRPSLIDRSGGWQTFSKCLAATGGVTTVKTPGGDP
jgi:hypothetical protein